MGFNHTNNAASEISVCSVCQMHVVRDETVCLSGDWLGGIARNCLMLFMV